MARLLYGLDRVPRSLSPDDPRLPGVALGPAPLRLNSLPVPPAILGGAGEGHAARLAAMTAWLQAQCGDYAVARRRFVLQYLDLVAARLAAEAAALSASLDRYDGLYAVQDWTWSAPRPLPRAWIPAGDAWLPADMAFWDGRQVTAICLDAGAEALLAAGIRTVGPGSGALEAMPTDLPGRFWDGEVLPRSPFRRPELARC